MPATSDQRALATTLAALPDAEVVAALEVRGVSPSVGWRDVFDAAEALLEPSPAGRALAALPQPLAVELVDVVAGSASGPPHPDLISRLLLRTDGAPYRAVADAVAALPAPPRPSPAPARPADADAEAAAAERAFTAAAGLADILLLAAATPLARLGSGGLGAHERRRLLEAGAVEEPGLADDLVAIAESAGLLTADARAWRPSPAARDWLAAPTAERWDTVARHLRDHLPGALRGDDGWHDPAAWPDAYPWDDAWPAEAERARRLLVAWGVLAPDGGVPAWSIPLGAGGATDAASLQSQLPPEVDRVFLQNDLTAIAPGPLAPALDMRLRAMARRESRAQAATYRFAGDSIGAAITAGETADSIRAFLGGLSLTGIPQPLAYLIDSTASRHGLVRVGRDTVTGDTVVTSADEAMIDTIAVDHALRPLGFRRAGAALAARVPVDAVYWALADARYPVVAVDAAGDERRVERTEAPAAEPAAGENRYAGLLERLRRAASDDTDAAWLERELDQAVRARAVVEVDVRLPDGTTRTFRLEASGLGGGRLRGRDRASDVERTLPLSSIAAVRPV